MGFLRKTVLGYKFMRLARKVDKLMVCGSDEEYTAALDDYRSFVINNNLNSDEHLFCEVIRRQLPGLNAGIKGHPDDEMEIDFRNVKQLPFQFLESVGIKNALEFRDKIVVFQYSSKFDCVKTVIKRDLAQNGNST